MADLMQTGGGVSSGASNLRILRVLRPGRVWLESGAHIQDTSSHMKPS